MASAHYKDMNVKWRGKVATVFTLPALMMLSVQIDLQIIHH